MVGCFLSVLSALTFGKGEKKIFLEAIVIWQVHLGSRAILRTLLGHSIGDFDLVLHISQIVECILPTFFWGNKINSTSAAYHNPISVNFIVLDNSIN